MSKDNYDDLEEEFLDEEEEGGFLSLMSVVIGFLAIAGFITLAWYAYRTGTESLQIEELEVVKADESPMKETPEDPGGWQFPHKDKSVYDTIATREKEMNGEEKVETRPEPETPVERKEVQGETEAWMNKRYQKPQDDTKPAVEEVKAADKSMAEKPEEKKPVEEKKPEPAPEVKQEEPKKAEPEVTREMGKKEPEPVKKEEPKPEVKKETPIATPVIAARQKNVSGPRVQLGAFKSESEAKASWNKVAGKHGDIIGSHGYDVVKADLGSKGVFYRLQITSFDSAAAAKSLCKQLSARKQDCFVVIP